MARPRSWDEGPDRARKTVRLPKEFAAAAEERAALRGMGFNDLVGELLSRELDMPYRPQKGLDFDLSA